MEMKQAINIAKSHILQAFEGEYVDSIRLEEIEYKENEKEWFITFGLYRPQVSSGLGFSTSSLHQPLKRSYKIVRVSEDEGRALSVRNRETSED